MAGSVIGVLAVVRGSAQRIVDLRHAGSLPSTRTANTGAVSPLPARAAIGRERAAAALTGMSTITSPALSKVEVTSGDEHGVPRAVGEHRIPGRDPNPRPDRRRPRSPTAASRDSA
jgi:hypothetical protein